MLRADELRERERRRSLSALNITRLIPSPPLLLDRPGAPDRALDSRCPSLVCGLAPHSSNCACSFVLRRRLEACGACCAAPAARSSCRLSEVSSPLANPKTTLAGWIARENGGVRRGLRRRRRAVAIWPCSLPKNREPVGSQPQAVVTGSIDIDRDGSGIWTAPSRTTPGKAFSGPHTITARDRSLRMSSARAGYRWRPRPWCRSQLSLRAASGCQAAFRVLAEHMHAQRSTFRRRPIIQQMNSLAVRQSRQARYHHRASGYPVANAFHP